VLTSCEVVEIKDQSCIVVEYQDECGLTQSLEVSYSEAFEKFNPAELGREGQINQLAGLDNIGNTCYMNAVVQCLIRTPSFGNYLEQQEFDPAEELLINEIAKIYLSSKTTKHDSINTRSFKRIFEKQCPYFEGYTQHDAQ
jgi:ubiquitin carboxyl-terminal hydrolase 4/11/15